MAQTKAQLIDGKGAVDLGALSISGSAPDNSVNLDASGRFLVGTSTARATFGTSAAPQFQSEGTTTATGSIAVIKNNASDGGYIFLANTGGSTVGSTTATAGSSELGAVSFNGFDGSNFKEGATIRAVNDQAGAWASGDCPSRLVFSTTADGASSPTERARIGSNGSFSVGGNAGSNDYRIFSVASGTSSSGHGLVVNDSAGQPLLAVRNDGRYDFGTRTNSPYNLTTVNAANAFFNPDGVVYRSTSSIRFKTNIEPIQNVYSDAILAIQPVWYRSKAPGDTAHPDWGYWGFVAEEVAEVDPRLVFWKTHETVRDEEGKETSVELDEPLAEGVQYDRFVPHLLNLIKRQKEQIESLEARLTAAGI